MMFNQSITLKDFQPINTWCQDIEGPRWFRGNNPKYLIDQTTGRRYWNQSTSLVRFKCYLLTLGTPPIHSIALSINSIYRVFKLVSFSHFREEKKGEQSYSFKERLKEAFFDVLRISTSQISFTALKLAAIYGVVSPYNGRKLYASMERAQYGKALLAPCFQPNPTYHAFRGDPEEENAF